MGNPPPSSSLSVKASLPASEASEVMLTELAVGNTYEFSEGDTVSTGVTVKLNSMTGDGYNEMTVRRVPYAPLYPEFPGKSPLTLPVRVELSSFGFTSVNIDIEFDILRI